MKIKILSDSTCDLSKEQVEALDITIVPLTIIKNDQEFKDAVSITPDVRSKASIAPITFITLPPFQRSQPIFLRTLKPMLYRKAIGRDVIRGRIIPSQRHTSSHIPVQARR